MKIFLSGGGTLGPVMPLLAIRDVVLKNDPNVKFVWVGTKNGPERKIMEEKKVPYFIIGAGKLRRYFSFWNLFDFIKIFIAFWQSFFIIIQERPDLVISCGGFVSVPLHWAAALLGVPAWVHQQDVRIGLANKLMFRFAKKVTCALRDTADTLNAYRAEWIGNPVRDLSGVSEQVARKRFGIPESSPVIFALGGGTGSEQINNMILEALPHWPASLHVIHLTGPARQYNLAEGAAKVFANYHPYQFFTSEMREAYAAADVIVARAGFSTITELAALSKAAVIVPMYGTHQEANARLFAKNHGIVLLEEGRANGLELGKMVKDLIQIPEKQLALGARLHALLPRAEDSKIISIIKEVNFKV